MQLYTVLIQTSFLQKSLKRMQEYCGGTQSFIDEQDSIIICLFLPIIRIIRHSAPRRVYWRIMFISGAAAQAKAGVKLTNIVGPT